MCTVWSAQRRAAALFLSSMTNNAAYVMQEPQSNLALICRAREINMNRFLNFFGSNSITGIPKFIEAVYPSTTVELLNNVRDVVLKLELHPLYFFRSSLRQSVYALDGADAATEMNMRLSDGECADMADIGIFSIGDLLQKTV